jgi:tyrosyl-tRNA synthetase
MSKSLGNYVGINEPAVDIHGKLMSVSDTMMWRYFELLTRLPEREIEALRGGHPMDAKKRLARTITAMYHGDAAAAEAEAHFERVFQKREDPAAIEEVSITVGQAGGTGGQAPLVKVLVATGYVSSNGEARRMIQQGAVDVDGARVSDVNARIVAGSHLVRVGKRLFKRVVLLAS